MEALVNAFGSEHVLGGVCRISAFIAEAGHIKHCLLYTSDAADERSSVDLGGRRIIKKNTACQRRRTAV